MSYEDTYRKQQHEPTDSRCIVGQHKDNCREGGYREPPANQPACVFKPLVACVRTPSEVCSANPVFITQGTREGQDERRWSIVTTNRLRLMFFAILIL